MALASNQLTGRDTPDAAARTAPNRDARNAANWFDLLPVGIVRLDAQLATLTCNKWARNLVGNTADWIDAWQRRAVFPARDDRPPTAPTWRGVMQQSLANDASQQFGSVRFAAVDGRSLTLNVTIERSEIDDAPCVLVIIQDVTQVAELTQRLAAAEDMAAVGKLAARVAHELNNPLDGALRYVNLGFRIIEKSGQTGDASAATEKVTEYLTQVREGLLRMTQIVRDLLEFSRNTPMLRESGNLNRVVEEAWQSLSDHADRNRVTIMADLHDDRKMPTYPGTKLFQVFCNLIKNALDAMPDGGCLTIRTGIVEKSAIVQLADTGPGLPDDPEKIFAPFYTTKASGKGTGLGLAICREYLEQIGGSISADNGKKEGAVFTVRVPLGDVSNPVTAREQ